MDGEEPSALKRPRRRAKSLWKPSVAVDNFFLAGSTHGGFLGLEEIEEKDYLVYASKGAGSKKKRKCRDEKPDSAGELEDGEVNRKKKNKKEKRVKGCQNMVAHSVGEEGNLSKNNIDKKQPNNENRKSRKEKEGACDEKAAESGLELNGEEKRNIKKKKGKRDKHSKKDQDVTVDSMDGIEDVENFIKVESKDDEVLVGDDEVYEWKLLRLHPLLIKSMRRLGFREPTPIQKACFPAAAHKGKDVIGAAQTGSGKTLAFGLPILQRLLDELEKDSVLLQEEGNEPKKHVEGSALRALIVTPTRELALQVRDHLKNAAKFLGIEVAAIVGGIFPEKQERILKRRPHIVVGTPGRLWELMSEGNQHLTELDTLSFFVLDEADRMIERGHFKELQSIIDMLPTCSGSLEQTAEGTNIRTVPNFKRKKRQTFLFSATIALSNNFRKKLQHGLRSSTSDDISSIEALSERAGLQPDVAVIDLTNTSIMANKLEESFIDCPEVDKDAYLYYILSVHGSGRTIVFCTSIAALRHISSILKILGINVLSHHAQMQQRARLKAMDHFRANENAVLIASDGAARGLDIENVRTVVHYQLPHSAEVYIHRSGRTARVAFDGCSIALISSADKAKFQALCNSLSKESLRQFPVDDAYMPEIMKRVSLARQIDKINRQNSQMNVKKNWLRRNAESAGLDVNVSDSEEELVERSRLEKATVVQLNKLQKDLKERLSRPLQPKTFSHRFLAGAGVTAVLQEQLKELAEHNSGSNSCLNGARRSGFVVIGQGCVEPLQALRDSGLEISIGTEKRQKSKKLAETRKRKKMEEKKRARDQLRKRRKAAKEQ